MIVNMKQNMTEMNDEQSISIAVVGSGGAGAITTGNLILEASAREGCYGMLTRSVGPQIRGGEAAALVRLGVEPINCISDKFDVLVAMDWNNIDRFAAEIPLDSSSIIISDPEQGDVPEALLKSGASVFEIPIATLAKTVKKGRPNMISLGIVAELIGLPEDAMVNVIRKQLSKKGEQAVMSSLETITVGRSAAKNLDKRPLPPTNGNGTEQWVITGNQATGYGALKGGIRFVAAYPITPATEVLEWMASGLSKVGGRLVQAEDELASVNMIIGASFGGVPSLTATSGPGLALMMEGLGLSVSSETPIVVVDVMRVGPSTGIATKPEQSDLNIAVYGFHGDAPHVVVAPTSVADCIFTGHWAVYLAEAMQIPVIMLSDQYIGQAKTIITKPEAVSLKVERQVVAEPDASYCRYEVTDSGVSPMSIPGTPNGQYTADGLEHSPKGRPSTTAEDHAIQMEKRLRKVKDFDYADYWADIEGEGELAIITWGSTTGSIREALKKLSNEGVNNIKMISVRLISPLQPEKFAEAMEGIKRVLFIEQNHSAQLYRHLRAHLDLPGDVEVFNRAGPLIIRAGEIKSIIKSWSES